jgi:hypothetical protein
LQAAAAVRRTQPPLRYGGSTFGQFPEMGKTTVCRHIRAASWRFSRILKDREIVVTANATTSAEAIVEQTLSDPGDGYQVFYSNQATPAALPRGSRILRDSECAGSRRQGTGTGPRHTIRVMLEPIKVQILAQ